MSKYFYQSKINRVWGTPIWTPIGRFAWPYLTMPRVQEFEGEKTARYEIVNAFEKDEKADVFLDSLNTMVLGKEGLLETFNSYQKGMKLSLTDELVDDGNNKDKEKYPYYQNRWVLLARNKESPPVIGKEGKSNKLDPSVILGGVQGRLLVTPHLGPSGLSFKIEAVQLFKDDGTRFGGGLRSLDKFMEAIGEESEVAELPEGVDDSAIEETEAPAQAEPPKKVRAQMIPAAPVQPKIMTAADRAAALKGRVPVQSMQPVKVPADAKVVTSGKGKGLALDNL